MRGIPRLTEELFRFSMELVNTELRSERECTLHTLVHIILAVS
jgi:hypothetical protein